VELRPPENAFKIDLVTSMELSLTVGKVIDRIELVLARRWRPLNRRDVSARKPRHGRERATSDVCKS
jgi:hypothetical protein